MVALELSDLANVLDAQVAGNLLWAGGGRIVDLDGVVVMVVVVLRQGRFC